NTWVTTPHLDRLAAEAVAFDQHYADCPGVRTAWTGRLVRTSGDTPDVPGLLRAQGITFAHVDANQLAKAADASRLETTLDAAVAMVEQLADQPRWLRWVDLPALQPPWEAPHEF